MNFQHKYLSVLIKLSVCMEVDAIPKYLRLSIDDVRYWWQKRHHYQWWDGYKGLTNEHNDPWMRLKSIDNIHPPMAYCIPLAEVYSQWMKLLHPWKFVSSMDEWVDLLCHLTRLMEASPTTLQRLSWNRRWIPWMRGWFHGWGAKKKLLIWKYISLVAVKETKLEMLNFI